MQRDDIVSIAKSKCNWGISESQMVAEVNRLTHLGVNTSDWCASFACYVYVVANCGDKINKSASAQELININKNIAFMWPSTETERRAVLQKVMPGDIISWWKNDGKGHTGIITSITVSNGVFTLTTAEGNSSNKVTPHTYTFPGTLASRFNGVYGILHPELTGTGGLSFTYSSLTNTIYKTREQYNPNTQLAKGQFEIQTWKNTDYQYCYYLHSNKYETEDKKFAPPLNTQTYNSHTNYVMPNMVGYCQGRAREVWDNQYMFQFGEKTPNKVFTKDNPPDFNYYYCANDNTMYQRVINYGTSTTENVIWDKFYSISDQGKGETPFLQYGGLTLKGTSHNMFRNAITNKMNIITAYQPVDETYSVFTNAKNIQCVPRTGSIAVWAENSIKNNSLSGYCAFVEKTRSDGKIYVSMSGRKRDLFFESFWLDPFCFANGEGQFLNNDYSSDERNRKNSSGIYFVGYIFPPSNLSYSTNTYAFNQQDGSDTTTVRVWII